mgnify:CR=1 FL=1
MLKISVRVSVVTIKLVTHHPHHQPQDLQRVQHLQQTQNNLIITANNDLPTTDLSNTISPEKNLIRPKLELLPQNPTPNHPAPALQPLNQPINPLSESEIQRLLKNVIHENQQAQQIQQAQQAVLAAAAVNPVGHGLNHGLGHHNLPHNPESDNIWRLFQQVKVERNL